MFGKLFGKKDEAQRGDDQVWTHSAARLTGLARETAKHLDDGRSVLIVALDLNALESLSMTLAERQPARSTDAFTKGAVETVLREKGKLTIALASALPAGASRIDAPHRVEILVHGRHLVRDPDDALCRFADVHGDRVRITFHLAFDDALLAKHSQNIMPILEKLGVKDDEAITSGMVTRAIAGAQAKNKAGQ